MNIQNDGFSIITKTSSWYFSKIFSVPKQNFPIWFSLYIIKINKGTIKTFFRAAFMEKLREIRQYASRTSTKPEDAEMKFRTLLFILYLK